MLDSYYLPRRSSNRCDCIICSERQGGGVVVRATRAGPRHCQSYNFDNQIGMSGPGPCVIGSSPRQGWCRDQRGMGVASTHPEEGRTHLVCQTAAPPSHVARAGRARHLPHQVTKGQAAAASRAAIFFNFAPPERQGVCAARTTVGTEELGQLLWCRTWWNKSASGWRSHTALKRAVYPGR